MNVGRLAAAVSLLVVLTAQVDSTQGAPTDWPQWRGPRRDGQAVFTAPARWPATLRKQWEVPIGLGHASPVIAADRVLVHTREGEREVTRALSLNAGKELWRSDYAAPYTMNPAARGHGPGPKSTPIIAGGRVFTFGISGILSAHDLASGKVLWRHNAPPAPPEFGTAMSPIVDGNLVIAHLGAHDKGALTAFDVATGATRWQWAEDGPAYASPVVADIGGTRQLITQSENALVGVAVANGQLLWRVPFKTSYDQNSVTPLVIDDLVVYSGLDNGTTAVRVSRTGSGWSTKELWRNPDVPMYMSSPVVSGNVIYGLSHKSRGQFFALDVTTGKTLWRTPGREGENASLLAAGPFLILTTTNAELIVARADPSTFAEVKRYSIAPSAVWAHPAVSGRTILVKDIDTLHAWSVE